MKKQITGQTSLWNHADNINIYDTGVHDKQRLKEKMGHLDDTMMNEVNNAIAVSFGLGASTSPAAEGILEGNGATPNVIMA